jgi:type 1 glutamine amidotransferase
MASRRIAALVGDYYHSADGIRVVLERLTSGLDGVLEPYTDPVRLPWDSLGSYQALVLVKENRVAPARSADVWATARHEQAIEDFAARGGALVGLHNGLASFDAAGRYYQTLRGGFQFHPKEHPRFTVRLLPAAHPITAGFQPFELKDEMYFVHVDSTRTTKLLELAHPDYGTSCAAWAHEAGRGRVFCFTPGHTPEALNDPGYLRVLERGLRWSLRLEQVRGSVIP